MKQNLLLFLCFLVCIPAFGQAPITLDTAPLQSVKTAILPTYDNLVKLRKASASQFNAAMKKYGYGKMDKHDDSSFSPLNSLDYMVHWSVASVGIYFYQKTAYTHMLEMDIQKRFPAATPVTSGNEIAYNIKYGSTGQHFYVVTIAHSDDGKDLAGATLSRKD